MREALIKLGIVLFCGVTCQGDHRGHAVYGAMARPWNCGAMLREVRRQPKRPISVLYSSLGMRTACLKRYFRSPRRKIFEWHLSNACCQRSHDCQRWEYLHAKTLDDWKDELERDDLHARRRWEKFIAPAAELIKGVPRLTCFVSPELESNLPAELQARLVKWTRPFFPGCRFVVSGVRVRGAYTESHGMVPRLSPPCIYSNDGSPLSKTALRNAAACRVSFLWHSRFNGYTGQKGPADRRHRKEWPTPETWAYVRRFLPH